MSAPLTLQQKNSIYSLERELFSRIAVFLHWGVQQTRELIGFWLWLEEQKFPNIIANLLKLSFTELRDVVEETIVCLNCAWTGKIPPPAYCGIPWTVKLVGEDITLQFFADQKETATEGMKRIMENEYREVFEDIETSLAVVSALLDSQISSEPMVINPTYLGSTKSTVPMSSPSSEGSSSSMVFHGRDSQLNHQVQVLVPKSRSDANMEPWHEHVLAAIERTRQPLVPVARSRPWNEYVPTISDCANQAQASIPQSWLSVDASPWNNYVPEASESTWPRLGILNGDAWPWNEFVPAAASDYANQGQAFIPQSWLRVGARTWNDFAPEASERTGQALLSMPTSMLSVNFRPWGEYLPAFSDYANQTQPSIPQSWLRVDAKPRDDFVPEASEWTDQAQVPNPSFKVRPAASEATSQAQVFGFRSRPSNEYEPSSERTMFFTFSRGYPFSEDELIDFLTEMFGDCIESITMQKVTSPYEKPMYAHVIFKTAPVVELILDGRSKAKFCFNGKHVWARRWERRDR